MKHYLKIWPQYYFPVKEGNKTFELRVNDRGFQNGDEVGLYYFDPLMPNSGEFGNPRLDFKVGYVLPVDAERVVFSLLPTTKETK